MEPIDTLENSGIPPIESGRLPRCLVFPLFFKLELLAFVIVHVQNGLPDLFVWVAGAVLALTDQFAEERLARVPHLKKVSLVLVGTALFVSLWYYLAALVFITEDELGAKLMYTALCLGTLLFLRGFVFAIYCLFEAGNRHVKSGQHAALS